MKLTVTSRFSRSYKALTDDQQEQIDDAIRKLDANPHHPFSQGLKVHKLKGVRGTPKAKGDMVPGVWEMHADGKGGLMVVSFQFWEDEIVFRNCGPHDTVLKNP